MKKFFSNSFFPLILSIIAVSIITFLVAIIFEKRYNSDTLDLFSSNLALDILGQEAIFFCLLLFSFHKMKKRKLFSFFLFFVALMILVDVVYYNSSNLKIRWELTAESSSIWIAPFFGVMLFGIAKSFFSLEEEKQNS